MAKSTSKAGSVSWRRKTMVASMKWKVAVGEPDVIGYDKKTDEYIFF